MFDKVKISSLTAGTPTSADLIPFVDVSDPTEAPTGTTKGALFSSFAGRVVNVENYGAVGDGVTDDWAAFKAAHDSFSAASSNVGGKIIVPKGTYRLSQTWEITKRVIIEGDGPGDQTGSAASILKFDANVTGIRIYSSQTSPTSTGGDRSIIRELALYASTTDSTGHGIHIDAYGVEVSGCVVRTFAEDGVHIFGNAVPLLGLANNWSLYNLRIVSNGGHGLFVSAADANAGQAIQVDCTANGGWGFYEDSKLGNTYVACHAASNATGSYTTTSSAGQSVFVGCYVETGTGDATSIVGPSVVIGGVLSGKSGTPAYTTIAAGSNVSLQMNAVGTGGRHLFALNGVELGRVESDGRLENFSGATFVGTAGNYTDLTGPLVAQVTTEAGAQDRFRFDNPNGRVGSITTSGTATAYNTSSDARMKDAIADAGDAGEIIDSMRVVSYRWKTSGKEVGHGFIAQELVTCAPQAVTAGDDGSDIAEPWGVDHSKLVPLLVKEIQALRARVRALELSACSA